MFCSNCGRQLPDNAAVCLGCGFEAPKMTSTKDTGGFGWGCLGFFVPLAGLILWLVWKDTLPRNAKSAGIGALIGVISSVALVVLYYLAFFAFMFIGIALA